MPLVVITGIPASGKTAACARLVAFLRDSKGKTVRVVSEAEAVASHGGREAVFGVAGPAEKAVRSSLKSEASRLLRKDEVVIVDGLNYIKGYRYELYCVAKAAKTTSCTVHCDVSEEDAWKWSKGSDGPYARDTFDALVRRYEPPSDAHRWESPLFLSLASRPLDCEAIYASLFERATPIRPNQSTQCQPLSQAGFLHELDRVTKDVVAALLEAQKTATEGDEVAVPGTSEMYHQRTGSYGAAELSRARRQFVAYSKSRGISDIGQLATMFVQYLNANVGK